MVGIRDSLVRSTSKHLARYVIHLLPAMSHSSSDLIPLVNDLLRESASTRFASLALPCTHMKSILRHDLGWGCGYRNALMSLSSLVTIPAYRSHLLSSAWPPSIRGVQEWIQQAWEAGYDEEGKAYFGGKLVKTRKWIGTSDLYAAFTAHRIPCILYDFPDQKVMMRRLVRPETPSEILWSITLARRLLGPRLKARRTLLRC